MAGSEKDMIVRTVRQVRETKSGDDEALLRELGPEEADDTLVCEVNRRFIRGHYANDTDIPKARYSN